MDHYEPRVACIMHGIENSNAGGGLSRAQTPRRFGFLEPMIFRPRTRTSELVAPLFVGDYDARPRLRC